MTSTIKPAAEARADVLSWARAARLHEAGVWKRWLAEHELAALTKHLADEAAWTDFIKPPPPAGQVVSTEQLHLQLRVRALLYDPETLQVHLPTWQDRSGEHPRAAESGAPSLEQDDVYYSLEYDAEDWEKYSQHCWIKHQVEVRMRPEVEKVAVKQSVASGPSDARKALQQEVQDMWEEMARVLHQLKSMGAVSEPFLHKVCKSLAPTYYEVIQHPMDLEKMTKRLHAGKYLRKAEFCHDIDLIVANCRFFNDPSSSYVRKANELSKRAGNLLKAANLPESDFRKQLLELQAQEIQENQAAQAKEKALKLPTDNGSAPPGVSHDSSHHCGPECNLEDTADVALGSLQPAPTEAGDVLLQSWRNRTLARRLHNLARRVAPAVHQIPLEKQPAIPRTPQLSRESLFGSMMGLGGRPESGSLARAMLDAHQRYLDSASVPAPPSASSAATIPASADGSNQNTSKVLASEHTPAAGAVKRGAETMRGPAGKNVLRVAVMRQLHSAGFQGTSVHALDAMCEAAAGYMLQLGQSLRVLADTHGCHAPPLALVQVALGSCRYPPHIAHITPLEALMDEMKGGPMRKNALQSKVAAFEQKRRWEEAAAAAAAAAEAAMASLNEPTPSDPRKGNLSSGAYRGAASGAIDVGIDMAMSINLRGVDDLDVVGEDPVVGLDIEGFLFGVDPFSMEGVDCSSDRNNNCNQQDVGESSENADVSQGTSLEDALAALLPDDGMPFGDADGVPDAGEMAMFFGIADGSIDGLDIPMGIAAPSPVSVQPAAPRSAAANNKGKKGKVAKRARK